MGQESTVYVVDDDPAVRRTIEMLLESAGLRAATYASAEEFLSAYQQDWRGCLILDICMPGMSGLDLQEQLAAMPVSLPIIMVTGQADVPMAVQAMRTGAVDVIGKPFSRHVLLERVREAFKRDEKGRQYKLERAEILERVARLTPREREVMDLIVAGKHTKGIAAELELSPKTVESYRASVMIKMGAENVADLVRRVVAAGPLPDQ
ncbi:MAG: response regulator transcription factor [Phycisphaerae bacterium]|nr:response regulator transcription factor [Phycisphaerae bacterium]